MVEKYREAGPSSICMTCSGIGHDRLRGCDERPMQCVICAGAHKSKNHKCGVTGCAAKKEKICIHVVPKCANCESNHQATAFRCPARQKAQTVAWKNKAKKAYDREERETSVESLENGEIPIGSEDRETLGEGHEDRESSVESQNEEAIPQPVEMELDINTNWAGSLEEKSSDLSSGGEGGPENIGKW